ncbi:VPA1262 family N-terminal domain-containing protein [Leptospirillum ferriphilum]|nr:VPA1262 family N-terminal domain-containing protein [Leptospirillum ferriphilum]
MKKEVLPEKMPLSIEPNPSPLQDMTLLQRDYVSGEVTLFYLRKKDPGGRNDLMFCVIEFLPPWLEKGPEEDTEYRLGGSSNYTVHFRRVHLPVNDALQLYQDFRQKKPVHIPQLSGEIKKKEGPWDLECSAFGEEPSWPHLQCEPVGDFFWEACPFWGFRPGGVRRHQLVPIRRSHPLNSLNPQERRRCREWLMRKLHFDLESRPIHIGSCHLVLPNPLFSNVGHHFDADRTRMHIRLMPFPGADLSTLSIILREFRPGGMGQVHSCSLDNNVVTVSFGYDPYKLGWDVVCSQRGVLFSLGPSMFIRSVHFNLGIVTQARKIYVPDKELRRIEETYSTNVVTSSSPIVVGEQSIPSGTVEIIKDIVEYDQKNKYAWHQDWFDDVSNAKKKLRELIGRATRLVRIVDPYLGIREFQSFALATTNAQVTIQILSSAVYLKVKKKGHNNENGEELLNHLGGLSRSGKINQVDVRVMPGNKPEIHDRFLVIDDQVWVLGSSLNEFGSRGTVMVRLPYPDVILLNINRIWENSSEKLEKFVSSRK